MGPETVLLRLARAVIVVVVEPGLADADQLRMRGHPDQPIQRDVALLLRLVWMDAGGAEDFVVTVCDLEVFFEPRERRADRHQAADPPFPRPSDDAIAPVPQRSEQRR